MPEPGVVKLLPRNVTWYLDKEHQVPVHRRGFAMASAFSGTSHSFAGASLEAAWIDCLPWSAQPDKEAQLSGYMALSRLSHIDDLFLTEPHSPHLFCQGDHLGPKLLLKYQSREIDESQLKAEWAAARPPKKKKTLKWPESLPLLCRGCTERSGYDLHKPLEEFFCSRAGEEWSDVIALGMDRMCRQCQMEAKGTAPESGGPAPSSASSSSQGVCAWCLGKCSAGSSSHDAHALCSTCRCKTVKCQACSKKRGRNIMRPLTAFSMERLRHWRKNRLLSANAVCLQCDPSKEARTKPCAPSGHWQCVGCQQSLPAKHYDPKKLRTAVDNQELHRLMCTHCEAPSNSEARRSNCMKCEVQKPVTLMTFETKYRKWICLDCQYPACSKCGVRQQRPRMGEYTCEQCMYPPCDQCGITQRPRNGKYMVTATPSWICSKCWPPCAGGCGTLRPSNGQYSPARVSEWHCQQCLQDRHNIWV